ncbi:MAG: hypothetical protein ACFB21_01530 [Opitutales bacterium]
MAANVSFLELLRVHAFFLQRVHRPLRLNPPQTFNEKIQWLKLYYRNPILIQLSDKIAVRDFVCGDVD